MPYTKRIENLQESHRMIDETIIKMEKSGADPLKITEMKKKKLQYRDEISRMQRVQWEHEHETVDFDDSDR
jgi:hypothetical protein